MGSGLSVWGQYLISGRPPGLSIISGGRCSPSSLILLELGLAWETGDSEVLGRSIRDLSGEDISRWGFIWRGAGRSCYNQYFGTRDQRSKVTRKYRGWICRSILMYQYRRDLQACLHEIYLRAVWLCLISNLKRRGKGLLLHKKKFKTSTFKWICLGLQEVLVRVKSKAKVLAMSWKLMQFFKAVWFYKIMFNG